MNGQFMVHDDNKYFANELLFPNKLSLNIATSFDKLSLCTHPAAGKLYISARKSFIGALD